MEIIWFILTLVMMVHQYRDLTHRIERKPTYRTIYRQVIFSSRDKITLH